MGQRSAIGEMSLHVQQQLVVTRIQVNAHVASLVVGLLWRNVQPGPNIMACTAAFNMPKYAHIDLVDSDRYLQRSHDIADHTAVSSHESFPTESPLVFLMTDMDMDIDDPVVSFLSLLL